MFSCFLIEQNTIAMPSETHPIVVWDVNCRTNKEKRMTIEDASKDLATGRSFAGQPICTGIVCFGLLLHVPLYFTFFCISPEELKTKGFLEIVM